MEDIRTCGGLLDWEAAGPAGLKEFTHGENRR